MKKKMNIGQSGCVFLFDQPMRRMWNLEITFASSIWIYWIGNFLFFPTKNWGPAVLTFGSTITLNRLLVQLLASSLTELLFIERVSQHVRADEYSKWKLKSASGGGCVSAARTPGKLGSREFRLKKLADFCQGCKQAQRKQGNTNWDSHLTSLHCKKCASRWHTFYCLSLKVKSHWSKSMSAAFELESQLKLSPIAIVSTRSRLLVFYLAAAHLQTWSR